MALNVCPAAIVAAPVETLWSLLDNPVQFNEWTDGKVEWVKPEGPMIPGQQFGITSKALGRSWRAVFTVKAVDSDRHVLQTDVAFPLGMSLHERVTCTPINATSCRVQYG
jgi:ligand-binding SRPBCC domain-containing protein